MFKNGPDEVAYDGYGIDYPKKNTSLVHGSYQVVSDGNVDSVINSNGPDQVAFDGTPIDSPFRKTGPRNNFDQEVVDSNLLKKEPRPKFKVVEMNLKEESLKRIKAINAEIQRLEREHKTLLNLDESFLSPKARHTIKEDLVMIKELEQEKSRLLSKMNSIDGFQRDEPSSTFEQEILRVNSSPLHLANAKDNHPSYSVSFFNVEPGIPSEKEVVSESKKTIHRIGKWVGIIFGVLFVGTAITVALLFTVARPKKL